jgi:hypothetical protein
VSCVGFDHELAGMERDRFTAVRATANVLFSGDVVGSVPAFAPRSGFLDMATRA